MIINCSNRIWNLEIKLLSIMVIIGITFSGMVFFMLTEEVTSPLFSEEYENLCNTGLCLVPAKENAPIAMFVQQNYEFDSEVIKQNNDDFSTLEIVKTSNVDFELLDNSAILYSTKDSLLERESKQQMKDQMKYYE